MSTTDSQQQTSQQRSVDTMDFSRVLTEELLEQVSRPGQYLGNEWGAARKPFDEAEVRLALSFPDLYDLGMSNFGLKILYQIVNRTAGLLVDRAFAPGDDLEQLLRERKIPLWGWESRRQLKEFELVGFSLQYELTYTNVLNMLELAELPVDAIARDNVFPLVFGGGPSSVNPEPMARFMDFFIIGDGEAAIPAAMNVVRDFKNKYPQAHGRCYRQLLLTELATRVPGVYVPSLYDCIGNDLAPKAVSLQSISLAEGCRAEHEHAALDEFLRAEELPQRVLRQTMPLSDSNQPTNTMVSYLNLVHDREVLEVRRGCDRGCRFCQPGYTFLPVRERSTEDLLKLSSEALAKSGHQEYSLLSLCVSDYTSLHESVRALNNEHHSKRTSLSFPSQRVDRMNLDLAEELKVVRKSGITLAPEAGTERMRAIINKGLSHQQIISAIEAAYQSGWSSVKLYFMCGLPMENDEDLTGIIDILKEATTHCRVIRKTDPVKYKREIEFTCTISNFVPKPFTPFQWFGQTTPEETLRKHSVLRQRLRESGLRHVQLNLTNPQISLLESVISRGDRRVGDLIFDAWKAGCTFDAWDERFKPTVWHECAAKLGLSLEQMSCTDREVGSEQPWEIVHIGLNNWWLVKEWEKAVAQMETAPCTENLCHACGVCTELDTTHALAAPKPEVMKRNPFVKELAVKVDDGDSHPSLFFTKPTETPENESVQRLRFSFTKLGELRFIGHLDLQHLLARAARRAGLLVAYTKGFNPQPKLNLAAPLAIFQQSHEEVGEVDLAFAISLERFKEKMNNQLPPEIQIVDVRQVDEKSKTSLASLLGSGIYLCSINKDATTFESMKKFVHNLPERIQQLLDQTEILTSPPESRAGADEKPNKGGAQKQKNIRPGILSIKLIDPESGILELELAHSSSAHVKPGDVLRCLQSESQTTEIAWHIVRTQLKDLNNQPIYSA